MDNDKLEEIKNSILDTKIDCPDCLFRTDDPDYTCGTCWCVGGDGEIRIRELFTVEVKKLC